MTAIKNFGPGVCDMLFAHLTQYGRPRCHCHDDMTWSAHLKLNTNVIGADFEINSGFRHETPGAALSALLERVEGAVLSLVNNERKAITNG